MSEDDVADPIFTRTWKRLEAARRELLLSTKRKVADRLKGVCDYMTWEEFDAFVTRVAELEIKYAMRRTTALLRPTVTNERAQQDRI